MENFEEMTALEMFEYLGWKKLKTTNPNYDQLIMYQRETPQHIQRITFDMKNKKVSCACLDDTYVKKGFRMKNTPMHVDMMLFQAIHKQLVELGLYEGK